MNDQESMYESEAHGRKMDLNKFEQFIKKQCTDDFLTRVANSQFFVENKLPFVLLHKDEISGRMLHCTPPLVSFKNLYMNYYTGLPTNTQYTEQGFKESGYIFLGWQSKKKSSILATALTKLVPDAMKNN